MTVFCARLQSDNSQDNVLLFLCRLLGRELNALLLDVLDMLASWAQQDIVPEEGARADAERLLEMVLRLAPTQHRGVVRIMLDVLERLG